MSFETGDYRNVPLADISNDPVRLSPCLPEENSRNRKLKGLTRAQSFRCLPNSRTSLDTIPSEAESIYDAEVIDVVQDLVPFESQIYPSADVVLFPPGTFRNSPAAQSHSRWPQATLDPIIERRSTVSLRQSPSRPHIVERSAESCSHIAAPQASFGANTSRDVDVSSQVVNTFVVRSKSFSLQSLDCLPKSDTNAVQFVHRGKSSSASTDVLRAIKSHPASPLQAAHACPIRPSTPPGLPSFGTQEAQEYRLTPDSAYHRITSTVSRWFRSRYQLSDEEWSQSAFQAQNARYSGVQHTFKSPGQVLRHVLGTTRIIDKPSSGQAQRARLPPGISIAPGPGALAQAQDGTLVRGRWGYRASAHGIGRRDLNDHPLAQVNTSQELEDINEEIDKACGTVEPTTEPEACYHSSPRTDHLNASTAQPQSAQDTLHGTLYADLRRFLRGSSEIATIGSSAMQEPGRYAPEVSTPSRNVAARFCITTRSSPEGISSYTSHFLGQCTSMWESCCSFKV